MYLNSDDINLNIYGVYIIKTFIIKNDKLNNDNDNDNDSLDILISQLSKEYLLLLTNLLNKNNKNLSFEILNILINISYKKSGELLFGEEEKVITNISNFVINNKSDIILLYYGVILIKNITYKMELVRQILLENKIIDFFNEIYLNYIIYDNFMKNLILCIGHFISSRCQDKSIYTSIKIIKTQLTININVELLFRYVYILYNLSSYNYDKYEQEMIKNKIHEDLMRIYPFNKQNSNDTNINKELNNQNNNSIIVDEKNDEKYYKNLCIFILLILGKLLSSEKKEIIKNLIESGVGIFLKKVLESSDIKIIKFSFFCLSNICAGAYGHISYLFDKGVIFEAIKVATYIYEILDSKNAFIKPVLTEDFIKAFREIIYTLSLIIINSLYERVIPFVRNNNYIIIKMLLKGLIIFNENNINGNNKDLIIYILNAIYKLIEYDKDKDDDEEMSKGHIRFSYFLEKNGFKEILEKLQTNNDSTISDTAEKIFDILFDDDDDNNEINIDDIVDDNPENNNDNNSNNDNDTNDDNDINED